VLDELADDVRGREAVALRPGADAAARGGVECQLQLELVDALLPRRLGPRCPFRARGFLGRLNLLLQLTVPLSPSGDLRVEARLLQGATAGGDEFQEPLPLGVPPALAQAWTAAQLFVLLLFVEAAFRFEDVLPRLGSAGADLIGTEPEGSELNRTLRGLLGPRRSRVTRCTVQCMKGGCSDSLGALGPGA
uniref:hypothetical protein n=1 Tax=Streptomyces sp. DSM 41033 TaxID=3448655 RepID=UPI00403FDC88